MRIGITETYFLDGADAPVVAAMEEAAKVLANRGATVSRIKLPLMDAVSAYGGLDICIANAALRSVSADSTFSLAALITAPCARRASGSSLPRPFICSVI